LRYASEERDAESLVYLVLAAHLTIKRLGEEGKRDPDDAAKKEAEDRIPLRPGANLARAVGRLEDARVAREEISDRDELGLIQQELGVDGRACLPSIGECFELGPVLN
jgi:hypothetical protein